jgi:serine/threonine protein kinase
LAGLYDLAADAELVGPRILSDRQYRDSPILSYRYGGFISARRLNPDGTHTLCLVSPTGEHVPDERRPYYRLPEWVDDPFEATPPAATATRFLLADRYLIDEARGFSNSGGIYYGTDTLTGGRIVIKEARPFTNCFQVGERSWDAAYLLAREYEVLNRLMILSFVPRPIELVSAGGHSFLVEERVEAVTARQFWASNEMILSPYIRRPGRVESWMRVFRQVARTLIEMITTLHVHGVLAGDLSPDNVLIDPNSYAMWLIDFESSVTMDDEAEVLRYAAAWGTPGFLHPLRSSRDRPLPQDDFYAAGMILFSALAPVAPLQLLNPTAAALFLDKFTSLGLPATVRDVLHGLWTGDVALAVSALAPSSPAVAGP